MNRTREFIENLVRRRKKAKTQPVSEGSKHYIPPVEGADYNICLTDVLNDRTQPLWTRRNLRAVPWTTVLNSPALAAVKDRAHAIYKQMTNAGSLCPLVTLHGSGVRLEFEMETMRSVFLLYPGSTLYGFGELTDPYPSGDVEEGLIAARGVTA